MTAVTVGCAFIFFNAPAEALPAGDGSQLPPAANRMKPDHAPTPFSAAEIRDANKPGTRIKFRIEVPGKPLTYMHFFFIEGDEKNSRLTSFNTDKDGKLMGKKETAVSTWKELQAHASFPEAETKITGKAFKGPMGVLECYFYTVTTEKEGKKTVKRLWFAKSLPGPPVYFEQSVDGEVIFHMVMLKKTT